MLSVIPRCFNPCSENPSASAITSTRSASVMRRRQALSRADLLIGFPDRSTNRYRASARSGGAPTAGSAVGALPGHRPERRPGYTGATKFCALVVTTFALLSPVYDYGGRAREMRGAVRNYMQLLSEVDRKGATTHCRSVVGSASCDWPTATPATTGT